MKNKPDTPAAAVKLRRLAEMKLIERKKKTGPLPAMESDIRRMVHELEVHQIEMEMQNEELVRARAETEAALQQFTELYDFAPVGYFMLARDGAIRQVNLAGASLVGVERSKLLRTRLGVFISTLSQLTFKTSLDRVFTNGKKETFEVTLIKTGADPFCVQIEATLSEAQDGQSPLCNAIIMDIDKRVRAELALSASRNFLQATLNSLSAHIAILDEAGMILTVNEAWRQFGRKNGLKLPEDGMRYNYLNICETAVGDQAAEALITAHAIRQLLASEISEAHIEYPCHSPHEECWFMLHLTAFHFNGQIRIVAAHDNITERKLTELELRHLSTHDPLTGLFNRGFFADEMARFERGRAFPVSILIADVDQLKQTNDQHGHAAGDSLLKRVAQVLTTAFRAGDVVARIGGDEFAVLLPATNRTAAEVLRQRVHQVIQENNTGFTGTPISLSLGVSTAEQPTPLAAVLKEADANMYNQKRNGGAA